jgi:hypothetical protein
VVVLGPVVVICTSGLLVKPKYGGKLVALNCGEVGLTTVPVTRLKRSATPLAVADAYFYNGLQSLQFLPAISQSFGFDDAICKES